MQYVALTPDGLRVAAVYPAPQPHLENVIAIADTDARYLAWAVPSAPLPNYDQFLTDAYNGCVAVATGTPEERLIEVSRRVDQYPSFVTAAQRENLALLQVVIARAHADYLANPLTGIPPDMEVAIRAALMANHVVGA